MPLKSIAFIDYVRTHQVVAGSVKLRPKTGGGHNTGKTNTAVGVRFGYEMHDQYIFHYCAMFFPHYHREAFISTEFSLKFTMCFLGGLRYLTSLSPGDTDDTVYGESIPNSVHRYRYLKSAFPQPLPTLPMSKEAAFDYMRECMRIDLRMRVCDARVDTFLARLEAIAVLTKSFRANPLSVQAWRTRDDVELRTMKWSAEQEEFLAIVADRINVRDPTDMAATFDRWMHITGGPGTGKTEAIIHAAYAAAEAGARVLILCPTGALVHSYKERLPPTDQIMVETLHGGVSIARKVDMNTYAPPGRLRRYDLIFIDEASQIGDAIFECIWCGGRELPQKPFFVVGADFSQVAPIGGGERFKELCANIKTSELTVVHRTDDPKLLDFFQNNSYEAAHQG